MIYYKIQSNSYKIEMVEYRIKKEPIEQKRIKIGYK